MTEGDENVSDADYPETVVEVLDDNLRFNRAALQAVREFRKVGPWRGSLDERKDKFRRLNRALSAAYDITETDLKFGRVDGTISGASHYIPAFHRIVLVGRLSVVTFLHEFAHARGMGERRAARWSVNLFRRCFPRQFSRLIHRGHMLVRPEEAVADRIPKCAN